MADFDSHQDPLPLAKKAIETRGDLTYSETVVLAKALIFAHGKINQLYGAIEKGPLSPPKLCNIANTAFAYVKKHGAGDSPEGLALVEAIDAAWRDDNA